MEIESSDGYRRRGALVERTPQWWVRVTGRRVSLEECTWLRGPVGDVDVIGTDFFARLADREGLTMVENGPPRDLVENLGDDRGWARYLKALDEDIRV